MRKCNGTGRTVLLIGKYALKFPTLRSWEFFLRGMLDNIAESKWKQSPSDWHLCPLLYSNRFGLLNIMPRCKPVKHRGLFKIELTRIISLSPVASSFYLSDAKVENFGILNNKLVKLDYAN